MAVKLLRSSGQWVRIGHRFSHVEKALTDMGIDGRLFEKAGEQSTAGSANG